eukprot:3589793-Rhodomonas_salina.2
MGHWIWHSAMTWGRTWTESGGVDVGRVVAGGYERRIFHIPHSRWYKYTVVSVPDMGQRSVLFLGYRDMLHQYRALDTLR